MPGTFASDVRFLTERGGAPIVVRSPFANDAAAIVVAPKYQGRVMTSAVSEAGASLGWINRAFIEAGKTGTPFDNFGGEDRFWLGPEGGQYGLYFPPGAAFDFDAWQTPHELQEGEWKVTKRELASVTLATSMRVTNWSRETFVVDVDRRVGMLSRDDAKFVLGLSEAPPSPVAFVGFESVNRITNGGTTPWRRALGLPSIWILGMFAPAADARVVVPFRSASGPILKDDYFGKVAASRLTVDERRRVILFSADGKERGKIGVGPQRAKGTLGSYSASARLLTIVQYEGPLEDAPYVNSMWARQAEPYAGDVVNAYNDGPPAPGKPPLGGFYEIETSSPGAELAPGGNLVHTHRTFHFVGEPAALDPIAHAVLGIGVSEIVRPSL